MNYRAKSIYLILICTAFISVAGMERSNTTGIHTDSTPIQSSGIERKPMTKKQRRQLELEEENRALRREKLQNIYNEARPATGKDKTD